VQVTQLAPITMIATLAVPGSMVGPVQLPRIHWSPETSVTVYDWRVIGAFPLFRRDNVMSVGEMSDDPDRVNDSGAGSTTLTERMQE